MRLSVYIDNTLIIGTSCSTRPNNQEEMIKLLEELIEIIKAPSVPYADLLDKQE